MLAEAFTDIKPFIPCSPGRSIQLLSTFIDVESRSSYLPQGGAQVVLGSEGSVGEREEHLLFF